MLKLRGGEIVSEGTYLNLETRKTIKIEENGVLPGTSSQSYWKVPPALFPMLGLLFIGLVPPYLSGLYAAYTEKLVVAYVTIGNFFIIAVLGGLAISAFRDRSALIRTTKTFRFRPDEPATETEDLGLVKIQSKRSPEE